MANNNPFSIHSPRNLLPSLPHNSQSKLRVEKVCVCLHVNIKIPKFMYRHTVQDTINACGILNKGTLYSLHLAHILTMRLVVTQPQ